MASFSFKDSTGKWIPISGGGGNGLAQLTETLTVEGWGEDNQQTLSIDDINEDSVIIVGASNDDIDVYNSCGIRAISQGNKTLTFSCEILPESAIEIIILFGAPSVVTPAPTPTPTGSSKIIRKDFNMDWENGTEYTYTDATITSNMNIINFVITTGDIAAPIHWETQAGKIIFSTDNASIGTISGYFFIADGGE